MSIDFYAVPTSNCRRVAIALEELGCEYTVHGVDRVAGEQHTPAYRAINPSGRMPAIVDREGPRGEPFVVVQSGAILLYLAEKTGQLLPPTGPERSRVIQWLMQVLTDVNPTIAAIHYARNNVERPDEATVAMFEERLFTYFRHCCDPLKAGGYLAGDLSLADIALYPLFYARRDAIRADPELSALADWGSRMAARAAVARGMRAIA